MVENESILNKGKIKNSNLVRLTECGKVTRVKYNNRLGSPCIIRKLNSNEYLRLDSGEILEFNKQEKREDNFNSIRLSIARVSNYINTNCTNIDRLSWVTLTYAQQRIWNEPTAMTDTVKLYQDFKYFIKKLRKKYANNTLEYITVAEPQASGSWHLHCILIWEKKQFIPNKSLVELWENGFVSINKINKNIDNLGAYFSCYLTDIEVKKNQRLSTEEKESLTIRENNFGVEKKYIKGGRLQYYPKQFNFYRISKGIKKPKESLVQLKSVDFNKLGKLKFVRETMLVFPNGSKSYSIEEHYVFN